MRLRETRFVYRDGWTSGRQEQRRLIGGAAARDVVRVEGPPLSIKRRTRRKGTIITLEDRTFVNIVAANIYPNIASRSAPTVLIIVATHDRARWSIVFRGGTAYLSSRHAYTHAVIVYDSHRIDFARENQLGLLAEIGSELCAR